MTLRKITNSSNNPSFEMDLRYASTSKIEFGNYIDFITNVDAVKKLIFVDPIVLVKQPDLLNLELAEQNITLVPTNIHEGSKSLESTIDVLRVMEDKGIGRRNELVCVIGGGAVMDTVSFAASVFRRGISVTKIPTTLLGIVDASIGIKTGVNFAGQRNRLGSYHFDFNVLVDPELLNGNSKGMIRQGLGEIFKIATIKGKKLFGDLKNNISYLEDIEFYKTNTGKNIMSDAIELMLEELHTNPRETELKRCVDFGHSFCPLVEMESLKRVGSRTIPHGYAVAYDCVLTTAISRNRQVINVNHFKEVMDLYRPFDFDFKNELYKDNNLMWASFLELTKHRGFSQNLPIPTKIGHYSFLQDVSFNELALANDLVRSEFIQ